AASRSRDDGDVRELLKLAGPLVLAYAGNNLLGFCDTAMVGRLGAEALGAVSMGNALFFGICLFGMGVVNGMDPLAPAAGGPGDPERPRQALAAGVRVAPLISLPLMAAIVALSFALGPIGVAPDAAALTRSFIYGRLFNAIPFFVLTAMRGY